MVGMKRLSGRKGVVTLTPYPTGAVTMFVSSTSANDANGGTGANSILIQGLDENYDEIEETVLLNGQTQVATQKSYLRLYRAFVTLCGTGGTSGGIIYVGSSGATAVYQTLQFMLTCILVIRHR